MSKLSRTLQTYLDLGTDFTVPVTNLWHFTLKASMTNVHAEVNAHSTDWLISIFVNELAPPQVLS